MRRIQSAMVSALLSAGLVMSVWMMPGAMLLQRTPIGPYSSAVQRVNEATPDFAAQ